LAFGPPLLLKQETYIAPLDPCALVRDGLNV